MITGFNTDIEHGGVTYHVQTEDKGLDTPIILSLVYVGGAILASKRTPYDDLIADGFEEKTLTERLRRQHKLICAAIRAGRIEELKHMGERDGGGGAQTRDGGGAQTSVGKPTPRGDAPPPAPPVAAKRSPVKSTKPSSTIAPASTTIVPAPSTPAPASTPAPSPATASASILDLLTDPSVPIVPEGIEFRTWPPLEVVEEDSNADAAAPDAWAGVTASGIDEGGEEDLYVSLLDDEGDFRAGQLATIKIYVGRGALGRLAVPEADVTVKVLGTTFRPLILSTQTDEEGLAVVRALLPLFTSGRAALLVRAQDARGDVAELRRIIHQA